MSGKSGPHLTPSRNPRQIRFCPSSKEIPVQRFLSKLLARFSKSRQHRRTSTRNRQVRPQLECLEERQLMSATPTYYWKLSKVVVDDYQTEREWIERDGWTPLGGIGQTPVSGHPHDAHMYDYPDGSYDHVVITKNSYQHDQYTAW